MGVSFIMTQMYIYPIVAPRGNVKRLLVWPAIPYFLPQLRVGENAQSEQEVEDTQPD